jgi:DNA-directed RNA polymerase specialized sigma54-like protein
MGTLVEPLRLCYVVLHCPGDVLMARRRGPFDIVQLKLRLEENVRRRLEHSAKANSRSLNSEIVHRLRQSFAQQPDKRADVVAEYLIGVLDDEGVLARMLELVKEEETAMDAEDSWKEEQLERRNREGGTE